jgi:crotonobetainyl-CoA:carnitine CoA-transferase CaiB-like acyl-CoA transferase
MRVLRREKLVPLLSIAFRRRSRDEWLGIIDANVAAGDDDDDDDDANTGSDASNGSGGGGGGGGGMRRRRTVVPAAPVNTVGEAFASPQAAARDMIVTVQHPTVGSLRLCGSPVKFSATPAVATTRPPPLLGEHTDEVLTTLLGINEAGIAALRESGVVA